MTWKDKNVLITDGTHFVGSHLAEKLVTLGSNVKAFIRYDYQNAWGSLDRLPVHIKDKIEVIPGSLTNPEAIDDADDVVDGLMKAAETPESAGEAINLGSGQGISIGDLADKILKLIGRDIEILFDATRIRTQSPDIERLVADITKANDLLSWQPKTSLDNGLKRTIGWFAK